MKLGIRSCAATGCQRVVRDPLLMCIDHWRMVPAPMRRQIVDLVKKVRYDRAVLQEYRDAVARAVAAVEEKQERKIAAAAGSSGVLFS